MDKLIEKSAVADRFNGAMEDDASALDNAKPKRINRKEQILQSLVLMLGAGCGSKVTTAKLAAKVGVSEAALYRHFPSKAKMFESLIEFVEETIFARIKLILKESTSTLDKCYYIITLVLQFCEKNPGISCILNGDALAGESDFLHKRVVQMFDRIELQFRQMLRDVEITESLRTQQTHQVTANLLMIYTLGKLSRYVGSGFREKPTSFLHDQWKSLSSTIFR